MISCTKNKNVEREMRKLFARKYFFLVQYAVIRIRRKKRRKKRRSGERIARNSKGEDTGKLQRPKKIERLRAGEQGDLCHTKNEFRCDFPRKKHFNRLLIMLKMPTPNSSPMMPPISASMLNHVYWGTSRTSVSDMSS